MSEICVCYYPDNFVGLNIIKNFINCQNLSIFIQDNKSPYGFPCWNKLYIKELQKYTCICCRENFYHIEYDPVSKCIYDFRVLWSDRINDDWWDKMGHIIDWYANHYKEERPCFIEPVGTNTDSMCVHVLEFVIGKMSLEGVSKIDPCESWLKSTQVGVKTQFLTEWNTKIRKYLLIKIIFLNDSDIIYNIPIELL
jgi:hypothetical protein